MKMIVAAFALAFAYPAAAQTAAPDAHAQHHQHAQHQPGQHSQHAQPQPSEHKGHSQGEHAECCCERMAEGAKMRCCEKHGGGQSEQHSGHSMNH